MLALTVITLLAVVDDRRVCDGRRQAFHNDGCCGAEQVSVCLSPSIDDKLRQLLPAPPPPPCNVRYPDNGELIVRGAFQKVSVPDSTLELKNAEMQLAYSSIQRKYVPTNELCNGQPGCKDVSFSQMQLDALSGVRAVKDPTGCLDGGKTVGKAIICIGGGFAFEACMAYIRAGGHGYIGSRTPLKQRLIKRTVSGVQPDAWGTAIVWTKLTAEEAQRLHIAEEGIGAVDLRNYTSIVQFLNNVWTHASGLGTTVEGSFLSFTVALSFPSHLQANPSSIVEDLQDHPDFFQNTDQLRHPDQFVGHYHANVYYIEAVENFLYARGQSPSSHNIVFTGSHVTLAAFQARNDWKRESTSAFAFIGAEYSVSKKMNMDAAQFGKVLGFKTNYVHPIACYTDWYTTSFAGSSWLNAGFGDTALYRTWAFGNTEFVVSKATLSNEQYQANLQANLNLRANKEYFGAFGMTPEQAFVLINASIAPVFGFAKWPRKSRLVGPDSSLRFEVNDYVQWVANLNFWLTAGFFNPTSSIGVAAQTLVDTCMAEVYADTEIFCTFNSSQIALAQNLLPATAALFGFKIAPGAMPEVIGFAAAKAVACGTDGVNALQYGIAGSFLDKTALYVSNLYTGSAETDERLKEAYLDASASARGRRFIDNSTYEKYVWA